MAQRTAAVLVHGNIVKSERKRGSMPDRDNPNGPEITWDFIEARLLTREFDTLDVRFPADGTIPVPERDELVTLTCEAKVAGGNLRLIVTGVLGTEDAPPALSAVG